MPAEVQAPRQQRDADTGPDQVEHGRPFVDLADDPPGQPSSPERVGAGLLFKGAVTQTAMSAVPASRAGVLAAFFIISYFGMGLPSIAFSIVIRYAAMAPTMIGFGAVLSVGTIVAVVIAIRRSNPRVN
jgi:hypothetical protein